MPDIDPLGKKEIKELAEQRKDNLVSIFIPTFRFGNQTEQNSIRFGNQINKARDALEKKGLKEAEIKEILDPAEKLLKSPDFWDHQNKGLAVFLGTGFFRCYRVPLEIEEHSLVSDVFHIEPLLPLVWENGKFYILSISKKEVRFFQADRYNINEMEIGPPASMEESLETKDPEKNLSFHTRASRKDAVFHGHSSTEKEKKDLIKFFQIINSRLQKEFSSEACPLVLAAVDYFHPLFQKACHYGCLSEKGIVGNPDNMNEEEMHKKAWKVVKPFFQIKEEEAKKDYQDLKGSPKSSSDPEEIIRASYEGRVSKLFISLDNHLWGQGKGNVEIHEERQEGDQDLCNLASIQVFLNGGDVYAFRFENMPEKAKMAAIFRY